MQKFLYKGLKAGKYTDGIIEALDKDEAIFKLREKKVIISNLKAQKSKFDISKIDLNMEIGGSSKIPDKEILFFTKTMHTMLAAGITTLEALKLCEDQSTNKPLKFFLNQSINDISEGKNLSYSFENHKSFDEIFVSLVKAGESTGRLDTFFKKLNDMLQMSMDIRKKLKKAMMYPATVFCVILLVTAFMLIKVVPIFEKMYGDMGADLPAPTQIVIDLSAFCKDPFGGGLLVICIIALIFTIKLLKKKNIKFRRGFDSFVLKLPVIGGILLKAKLSRFAMVMENLSAAGVGIIEMLDIAKAGLSNMVLTDSVMRIQRGIYSGESISELFKKEVIFPKLFTQLISVGEQSGNMVEMYANAGRYLHNEFVDIADNFNTILEPIIIVVMGVVVGGLLIALYTPMFNMGAFIK